MPDVEISFDLSRIDFRATSDHLMASYWGSARSDEMHRRAFFNSLCVGAYLDGKQVGFARSITDYTVFAWPTSSSGRTIAGATLANSSCRSRAGPPRPPRGEDRAPLEPHDQRRPQPLPEVRVRDRRALYATGAQTHRLTRWDATTRRCCKIVPLLGPDVVLGTACLGEVVSRLYKSASAIPFWEDRIAGLDIVRRGREA